MTDKDGCVTFNKASWHYRLVYFVFPWFILYDSHMNLCPYMRHVIASIFLLPFIAGWRKLPDVIQNNAWVAQAELIFLFLVMIVAVAVDYTDVDGIFPPWADMVAYGFLGGNVVGVIAGSVILGVSTLIDYITNRPKKDHRTRGLIKTYVQAKHDKICPCVEFEE